MAKYVLQLSNPSRFPLVSKLRDGTHTIPLAQPSNQRKLEKLASTSDLPAISTVTHELNARAFTPIVCHIDDYSRDLGFDVR